MTRLAAVVVYCGTRVLRGESVNIADDEEDEVGIEWIPLVLLVVVVVMLMSLEFNGFVDVKTELES